MKHSLLLICLLLSTVAVFGQSRAIKGFIDKYENTEDVTNINLTGNLLSWVTEAAEKEGGQKLRSKIESLRVLSVPNRNAVATEDLSALRQSMYANNYEELIRVRDGKELVYVYLQEDKNHIIEELVVLVEAAEEVTLVSIAGRLRYEDLQQLNLDGEAGDALDHLPVKEEPRP